MPKTILNYSNTIMYKIVCDDLNVKDCYVGHTTNMTKRKYSHKSICHNEKSKYYNRKIYQIIRQTGGWSNWSMILVEKFPCRDKHEACKREREIFEELDVKMNMVKPYITQEETRQYNKKYNKKYHEEHKVEINEKTKKYHEEHKVEINERHQQYYQDNKEQIKEKQKKKAECEFCTKQITKGNISQHIKSCKSKPKE